MGWEERVHNLLGHCTTAFGSGSDIFHCPPEYPPQKIPAIWSDIYLEVDIDTGVTISSNDPNIGVRLADINHPPKKGDGVYKGPIEYRIRNVKKDGEGGATLILELIKKDAL